MAAPSTGPASVPTPPRMLISARSTDSATVNTVPGSMYMTYCAISVPPIALNAALTSSASSL